MQKENLSALMDGESFDPTLFASLTDSQLSQRWQRYHLIRDTLRNDISITVDVTQQVAQAIQYDPLPSEIDTHNVVSLPQKKPLTQRFSHWLNYGLQAGVAASVSLFIIAGVKYYQQPNDTASNLANSSHLPVLTTLPVIGNASPVSFSVPDNMQQKWQEQNQLNQLLQNYELQRRLFAEQSFMLPAASAASSPQF